MNPGSPPQSHAIFFPSVTWVAATGFVFAGAVAYRLPGYVSKAIHTPVGFFLTAVAALVALQYNARPLGFAILFFLLCAWSTATIRTEGFVCLVENVDAVENPKRKWYVEEVLKEMPMGIKTVADTTSAVGGFSAQSGTSAGTT